MLIPSNVTSIPSLANLSQSVAKITLSDAYSAISILIPEFGGKSHITMSYESLIVSIIFFTNVCGIDTDLHNSSILDNLNSEGKMSIYFPFTTSFLIMYFSTNSFVIFPFCISSRRTLTILLLVYSSSFKYLLD